MTDETVTVSIAKLTEVATDHGIEVCFYESLDDDTDAPDVCPWCGGAAPVWEGCREAKAFVGMMRATATHAR